MHIGQLHPLTVYRTGFGVFIALVWSVIVCSFFMTIIGIFMVIIFILTYRLCLSESKQFWFCKCAPPGMFLPRTFPLNIGLNMFPLCLNYLLGYSRGEFQALQLIALVVFLSRGLTNCLLYVGPLFGNQVWNDNGFDTMKSDFFIVANYDFHIS